MRTEINSANDTLNRSLISIILLLLAHSVLAGPAPNPSEDIQIIQGEDRTIYEYRSNGRLLMIKVVPKKGRPYYMVPADGSPHYQSLETHKKLYPKWVIIEW
jgi:hypothetical protein